MMSFLPIFFMAHIIDGNIEQQVAHALKKIGVFVKKKNPIATALDLSKCLD